MQGLSTVGNRQYLPFLVRINTPKRKRTPHNMAHSVKVTVATGARRLDSLTVGIVYSKSSCGHQWRTTCFATKVL